MRDGQRVVSKTCRQREVKRGMIFIFKKSNGYVLPLQSLFSKRFSL